MADKETTTTTTVDESDATTTTTTVEAQGEVAVDENAKANVLGGENSGPEQDAATQEKNREDAKRDGLRNAQGDQDLHA